MVKGLVAWLQLCRTSEDRLLLLGCFIERLSEPANEASKTNNNKAKNKDIKRSSLRHEGAKHYQRDLLAFPCLRPGGNALNHILLVR